MKSYKIIENGKPLKQVEIDKPVPVGDEILVKTVSCGVCHSDVHIYEGFFDLGGGAKLPSPAKDLAMGHEVFGEVVELGENVKDLEIGKKYVVYPWIGCGKCEVCLSGNELYCGITTNRNIGITRDGGYGEYVLVPDKKYLFDAGNTHDDLAGSYACRGPVSYTHLTLPTNREV